MRAWYLLALLTAACGSDEPPASPGGTSGTGGSPAGGSAGAGGESGSSGQAGAGGDGLSGASGSSGTAGAGGSAGAAGAAGSGGAAGSSGAAGAGGAAGAPVRTVETRSPFGDLTATNLVLDGDFEFSPASSIVPPWLGIQDQAAVPLVYETGGQCLSGIYCVRVLKGVTVANFAVSLPPDTQVKATMRMRPPNGKCKTTASASLFIGSDKDNGGTQLKSAETTPDASGWCTLTGTAKVPATVRQASIYVSTQQPFVVVDRVVVEVVPAGEQVTSFALSPAERERGTFLERFRRQPVRRPLVQPPRP